MYPSIDPTRPELSAKGKVVLITGGGTGIGAETALCFAKAGAARIAILGRRGEPLLDTKDRIEADFPDSRVLAIPTDITRRDQVEAAFAKVAGDDRIDVLVSNAAVIGVLGDISALNTEDFLSGIITNLQANFNVTTSFLKYASKHAVLIETNSAAAHLTFASGFASYNVAKAATVRFYQSVAFEHPELSIFNIHPGAVETALSKEAGYEPNKRADDSKWKGEGASELSECDDVRLPASFMVWVASPEATFLKGRYLWANWDVDELKSMEADLEGSSKLRMGLMGWPFA